MRGDLGRLRDIVEHGVEGLGYELVDVELSGGGHGALLRVYIDSRGGINLADCERVSRQLSAVLDVEDPISGHYTLEVSSPGLDRPLVKRVDFERYAGSLVKVRLAQPLSGRRNFVGRLTGIEGDRVIVHVDGESYDLPYDEIEKARLVPEL